MARYVQTGAVHTWYDEHGAGEPLVLLHGGLVDARWFEPTSLRWRSGSTSTRRSAAATGTPPTSTVRSPTS